RQTGKLCHHAHQTYSGHACDIGIVFRHIADCVPDLSDLCPHIHSQDTRGSFGWRMKSKECLNQRTLTGAVRSKQTNSASGERSVEVLQNGPAIEEDGQVVEFYGWDQFGCLAM